jgi:purine-nucleoside phosphorylase
MLNQIHETAEYLKKRTGASPQVGIILGTGLGGLVNEIAIDFTVPYEEIPHFPVSTVEGHSGKAHISVRLGGKKGACHARTLSLLRRLRHEAGDVPSAGNEGVGH